MHPDVFEHFDRLCRAGNTEGRTLEIGAVPSEESLLNLPALKNAKIKLGVNLIGPAKYKDFIILAGNANILSFFADDSFDMVLCNSVIEHDKYFWLTIAEIRRVAKPGALIIIGAPGYTELSAAQRFPWLRILRLLGANVSAIIDAAVTLPVHNYPVDYYRFSVQSFQTVIMAGLADVEITTLLAPPRIIGSGFCQK